MPPDFPALTLPTMRALAVLYEECGDGGEQTKLVAALDALYAATWVERKATHKGDVLMEVLEGVLGEGEAGRGMFFYFLLVLLRGLAFTVRPGCIFTFTTIYASMPPPPAPISLDSN